VIVKQGKLLYFQVKKVLKSLNLACVQRLPLLSLTVLVVVKILRYCHSSGAAGAPTLGDIAGWAPRIGQGIDTLHTHAISDMPAKGLCMDCSDDEIKVTVDYIVSKSQ
jgi:cytochrome c5